MPQIGGTALDAASNQIGCCLSPTATRDGRYRSFGGGNEEPRPPLICDALTSIMAERVIEPETNG
jgi:hypothetical protein